MLKRKSFILGVGILSLFLFSCAPKKETSLESLVKNIEKNLSSEEKKSLEELAEKLLKEPDITEKVEISKKIKSYGRKAIPALVEIISHTGFRTEGQRFTRNLIARLFAGIKPEGEQVLFEFTRSQNYTDRYLGLVGLSFTENKKLLNEVLFLALYDEKPQLRKYASSIIVELKDDKEIISRIIKGLTDPSYGVRLECALILGKRKIKEALLPLKEAYKREFKRKDFKKEVAIVMAGALLRLGDKSGYEFLIGNLANINISPSEMDFLKEALREVKDKRIIPQLIKLLESSEYYNRYFAITWLFDLTRKTFGFRAGEDEEKRREAIKKWQEWWRKNEDSFKWQTF